LQFPWKRIIADNDAEPPHTSKLWTDTDFDDVARFECPGLLGIDLDDVFQIAILGRTPTYIDTDHCYCQKAYCMHGQIPPCCLSCSPLLPPMIPLAKAERKGCFDCCHTVS
jgi:hypothetical protein